MAEGVFFDTLKLMHTDNVKMHALAEAAQINFRYAADGMGISLDQTTSVDDLNAILAVFAQAAGKTAPALTAAQVSAQALLVKPRQSAILSHPVFNSYHSETEMMRYIKRLENKDLSLTHSMISLGSCTMKLNAASEMLALTWPEFANLHPFVPLEQAEGYQEVIAGLDAALSEITGFAQMSFQPNSGASGEYAGLLVIQAYHRSRGEAQRNVVLIPSSAHGTNPASAAMCGMHIVVVKCDSKGNIDVDDLRAKAEEHKADLSCLMVTYPSTHGVYEESIKDITAIIHANGGQVYMDGANMNAQVGLTSPGNIGADVCHLNLHKTFAIPHGGGGPGAGPIGVAEHLTPFLPSHPVVKVGGAQGIHAVSAAPYGSALILLISYGYIKMMGGKGLTEATKMAILNANYIKESLKDSYATLYSGSNGRCAHEMILDCREWKKEGVEVARHRQAPDGLRLPRADHFLPGGGHADGRADRERIESRAGPLLRRDDRHPQGDRRSHQRQGGQEGQHPQACAAYREVGLCQRVGTSLLARAGRLSPCPGCATTSSGLPWRGWTMCTATRIWSAPARR